LSEVFPSLTLIEMILQLQEHVGWSIL